MRLTNTDVQTRVWPALSVDGHTLELPPGGSADVDVPDGFTDPYLRPVREKPVKQDKSDAAKES